jgi:hypothetical protein
MKIEVSNGEIVDKFTILEIKSEMIKSEDKLDNIIKEKSYIEQIAQIIIQSSLEFYNELKNVNKKLWDIEDNIRQKERKKEFDEEFIELARSVYHTNDIRAELKKKINMKSNSKFIEEKSYEQY